MINTKSYFAVVLVLTTLAACAKSGSSNSPSASPISVPVNSYSEKPADGEFVASGTPVSKAIPERFALGCEKPGSDRPGKAMFDSRLRTGQTFEFKMQDSYTDGAIEADLTESVFQISTTELVDKGTISILNGATGFPSGAFTKTCSITRSDNGREAVRCDTDPHGAIRDFTRCQVVTKDSKSSEVAGAYTFKNGDSVKAYKAVQVKKGQIMCQSKSNGAPSSVGDGVEITIRIVSNEIVANTPVVCGGSVVFNYRVVRLTTGSLMSSERTEMLQVPTKD